MNQQRVKHDELQKQKDAGDSARTSKLTSRKISGLPSTLVRAFDGYLRRRLGVREYSNAPQCILRLQLVTNKDDVLLVDGTRLRPGAHLIELHYWNEQMPALPTQRALRLGWARHLTSCFEQSLCELAQYMASQPDLNDVRGIRANMSPAGKKEADQLVRILCRYGFEWVPSPVPQSFRARLRRLGENMLISTLASTYNPDAGNTWTLSRGRMPLYISRQALERRYAAKSTDEHKPEASSPQTRPRSSAGF
jgi:hypothetical protein